MSAGNPPQKANTGISGLDDVLCGGLTRRRLHLLEGHPGTGKTTIALQFILAGAAIGEKGLYITLSETEAELRAGAEAHGWVLTPEVDIFELVPPETLLDPSQQQSLLYASDLELGETIKLIFDAIERSQPARIVLDSLSEIRLLAQSSLRYRRQLLALKHSLTRRNATIVLLDDLTSEMQEKTVHSIADVVLHLEQLTPLYGAERRRLRVTKYRAQGFRGGYHDFTIVQGGVQVFPRLVASEHYREFDRGQLSCGIPEMDDLLGGGVEWGSSTLILGPTGTGKSLLALLFALAAVERGERAAMFIFDEEIGLLMHRAKGLGIDLEKPCGEGRLILEMVDAAELSPGEFIQRVRHYAEHQEARTIVVDSLNGYQAAMPEEQFLILHMHELLTFLNRQGAATFVTVAQHGLVGDMKSPVDVTYLADTVLLLRYFEAQGRVRRAISVIKKRSGPHENAIREYQISESGIRVGDPLTTFHGIFQGVPQYVGQNAPLLEDDAE